MKKHGLSLLSLAGAALGGSLVSYVLMEGGMAAPAPPQVNMASAPPTAAPECDLRVSCISGFQRVRPMLSTERVCESPRLDGLRSSIATLVDELKATGQVNSASVYVRDLRQSEWTAYNGNEPFDPGSLLKVALLLTYLSMSEEEPGLLHHTLTCEKTDFDVPQHTEFPSAQVALNASYTVAQLLEYMMVHSDNRATTMLHRHVSPGRYIRTYTDLGLPAPDPHGQAYRLNVQDYSVFLKALYNSALLSPLNSEYALELMTRAEFKEGLVAGLPAGIDVAHKFGETVTPEEQQLHEVGLVYAEGHPYLVTVMTRGMEAHVMAGAIASISRLVYERMSTGQG